MGKLEAWKKSALQNSFLSRGHMILQRQQTPGKSRYRFSFFWTVFQTTSLMITLRAGPETL